jgi:hypothetical protein
MGKYDLIEGKEIDEALKELCYKMVKLVRRYIHIDIDILLNIFINNILRKQKNVRR